MLAREGGDDCGGGINGFIAWNSSVAGDPDK